MPASSINLLCVSGRALAAMARANTTAKNAMPLSGTVLPMRPRKSVSTTNQGRAGRRISSGRAGAKVESWAIGFEC